MTGGCASLLAFTLCFAGMSALAFAMDRHHAQLTHCHAVPTGRRRLLRASAGALLGLACRVSVVAWGGSVGTVAFIGFLSTGALPVAFFLSYRPALLAALAALAGLSAPVLLVVVLASPT